MATAKGGGEAVLERSASPCSNQQKGLDFNLDYHGYSRAFCVMIDSHKRLSLIVFAEPKSAGNMSGVSGFCCAIKNKSKILHKFVSK